MADISVEHQSGSRPTWIFALVAVLAVLALMFWLNRQSRELSRTAAVQGDTVVTAVDGTPGAGATTAQVVELAAVGQNPEQYEGQTVAFQNTRVAAPLGPRAFWADIPGANPFLVILGQNIANVQMPIVGQRMDVEGNILPVSEQQIADWVTAGVISQGSADEASFATHHMMATRAQVRQ